MKKGQAAMEFLMTYGWAILIVLISIGALAYFGVLNPSRFVPNSCVLFPGLACIDSIITETSITLVVINGFGKDITLSNMDIIDDIDGSNCPLNVNGIVVPDGSTKFFSFGNCINGIIGSRFRGSVSLTYSDGSISHTKTGSLVGQVENVCGFTLFGNVYTATPCFSYEEDNNPYWGPVILNTNDLNFVTMSDEGIVNPDYTVIGFPPLGIADTAGITSASLKFNHRENLPVGCYFPVGETDRHKVSCYDGSNWQLLETYADSSSFVDSTFDLAACVSTGADANNIVVQITFDPTDPGTGVCGTMDIDSATITVQT